MDALPSGTVSFCFTDIEGSTKLFARLGARYVSFQEEHRRLINEAAALFGGVVIKTEGDGCFLAFQEAALAVKAAGAMQHAIDHHGWPQDARIRIRVGVHTGEAQPAGGDYVALAVHQAARVADSGHGGQVIVSAQTAAHLEPQTLAPFRLADLGEYRLRSFDEACHLFQLVGPGLAGAFPPLRTRTAVSRRVRIFLSSPGDVRAAREIAALTIERLAQDYARFFPVEEYFWDHEAMLASGQFQDPAEPPGAFDIVVLTVWSRLGTALPERTPVREYRGVDGRAPLTGTEWVFEEALQAATARGAPDLLVYRSLSPASCDLRDTQLRDRQLQQLTALDRFWSQHFANAGAFCGVHTEFTSDAEFAEVLEKHLRQMIDKRIAAEGSSPGDQTVKVWMQTPFRGLEAYEFEHAAIFFGQDEALTKAMVQLVANAEAGSPFLIVLGASGSGKSSLVKAGIVPKLFVPRRIPGAAFLRRVVFRPSDAQEGEDLFDALARRLTTQVGPIEGLPELIGRGQSVASLAAHLRNSTTEPAYPIGSVLGQLTADARLDGRMLEYETAKLVLVIDQLEELFTNELLAPQERQRFIALLAGLVRSGLVWVIATMRNDFWHRAIETPDLMQLAQGNGRLELTWPTQSQLGQMIRRPAEAAGIGFEHHSRTDAPLNEVIAEAVAREPGALPLLSYLLDQLYRGDVLEAHGDALTFATYERLGKLEGAIAAKAESVLGGCAPGDREALGSVLFLLVQMGAAEGDLERAIARRVPLSAFAEGTPQRRLVEALLDPDARLLVSDAGKDGNPTVRVAHEALITHWTRAREFVLSNAAALKIRRRIEERYAMLRGEEEGGETAADPAVPSRGGLATLLAWWSWSGRQRGLLSEIDLADGQRLLAMHRSQIEPHLAAYIERSAADEQRVRTRSFRVLAGVAIAVALLAVFAFVGQHEAQIQAHRALQAQSRLLTLAAAERLGRGDVAGGEGIVLEVLANLGASGPGGAAPAVSVFQEARAADGLLAVLSGHGDIVATAAYSPDGRRIVTGSMDQTARIWDAATGAQLVVLSGHGGTVESATFSPDGRRIVTASDDKTARIWDAATGAQLAVLSGHDGIVISAAFSPDGRDIVTASFDKTVRIWDATTGRQRTVFSGHGDAVESAAYSPDGRRIVTASDDKTARIWDAATGAQLAVLSGHGGIVTFATYAPDGRHILTASNDKTARIWDAATGAQLAVLSGHGGNVNFAAYSPDGRRIVTASNDKTARIWDGATGAQLAVLSNQDGAVEHAAFSPDGRRIVTASADKTARIWDAGAGAQLAAVWGHGGALTFAAYSPDGRRIVTASWDKTARIWDAADGAQLALLSGHDGTVWFAAFSPDGRRIVTASDDKTARIWDGATGAQLAVLSGHGGGVRTAAFSPDGRRIVTASYDKTTRVWDGATGAQLAVISGHGGGVYSAAFSPDGRRIVTASDDKTARIWDAADGAQLATLSGHDGFIRFAAWSPDGRRIVTASADKTARIWDAADGAQLATLSGHDGPVYSAAYSPDGRRIVTASLDRTARIWDVDTGAQLAVLSGHEGGVFFAAYSPDGRRIVTASDDKSARIWDARIDAGLPSQIVWARAAQVDPLSDVERSVLGLPAVAHAHAGARTGEPDTLGRLARREEVSAIGQPSTSKRDALLLMAFRDFAAAAARAQAEGWPDDAWRHWRYRRATLARLLARDGMMQQVADAYARVSKP
jgi:WD40 repeat protein/class 3 adenylate cyclase